MSAEPRYLRTGAMLAVLLAVAWVLIALVSQEPLHAFRLLTTGALPEVHWSAEHGFSVRRLVRFGAVVEQTITLSLLGLAVLMGFRARQFCLGADGQFFLGALAAALAGVYGPAVPGLGMLLACAAAMAAGFAWGWLVGVLKAYCGANEMVTSLMLNVVAIQLYRLVITLWFNDPAAHLLVSPTLPPSATFQPWLAHTNITAFVLTLPLAAGAAWWLLQRTTIGFEMRTVGDAAAFAEQVGMPVRRTMALSMAIGGAFAGLAGMHVSNALLKRLPVDMAPGIGFEGMVIALLARNDPKAVPLAAFLYAYLTTGAQAMERASDVPHELVFVLQACIVLLVVSERLLPARGMALLKACWQRVRAGMVMRGKP